MKSGRWSMGVSLASVIDQYLDGSRFKELSASSKDSYKRSLMMVRKSIGEMDVDEVKPYIVQALLDGLTDFPGKQINVMTAIKAMESWALLRNLLPHAITVKRMDLVGSDGGYDPWTDHQIELALTHLPPHLARVVKLEINTGQRSSDIIRMRWSDLKESKGRLGINVTQKKTGVQLFIPFWDDFAAEISAWERQSPIIVLDGNGLPYATRNRLSKEWGRERDENPALEPLRDPPKVLHGLRSTTVVRLRKLKLSEGQISSLVGMSEPMVARYARHADKEEANVNTIEQAENMRGANIKVFRAKVERNQ